MASVSFFRNGSAMNKWSAIAICWHRGDVAFRCVGGVFLVMFWFGLVFSFPSFKVGETLWTSVLLGCFGWWSCMWRFQSGWLACTQSSHCPRFSSRGRDAAWAWLRQTCCHSPEYWKSILEMPEAPLYPRGTAVVALQWFRKMSFASSRKALQEGLYHSLQERVRVVCKIKTPLKCSHIQQAEQASSTKTSMHSML